MRRAQPVGVHKQPDAPSLTRFPSIWAGPASLGPFSGKRVSCGARPDCSREDPGVHSEPHPFSSPRISKEIQSAAAFSDPPRPIPGGLHSTAPANTAVETKGQSLVI